MSAQSHLTRREWVARTFALAGVPAVLWAADDEELIPFLDDGEFVADRQLTNPRVKNFDLRRLRDSITPTEEFFVFHQTSVPALAPETWRLHVGGLVQTPRSFSMAELVGLGLPTIESEV